VSGFLRELPASDRADFLSLLHLAFRDRPVTEVLFLPVRTAHVSKQNLQAIVWAAPEQNAGARSPGLVGHLRRLAVPSSPATGRVGSLPDG